MAVDKRAARLGALALVSSAACSDDDCGPMGAPSSGLVASSVDVTLEYGDLTSLAGNDCPDPNAPAGVVSISIEGSQQNGGAGLITLCIPRPDLLTPGVARTIGTSQSMADVRIFDLGGEADGCTYAFDATRIPTGRAAGIGVCGNGDSEAGFALDIDGAVSLRRTCGQTIDTVAVTFVGRVAVSKREI